MKLKDKLVLAVVPRLGRLLMRLIAWSARFEVVNRPMIAEDGRGIFAFWHGRMLMMPFANEYWPMAVMVSRHKDGELISRTVGGFGIRAVRGSTTRGGRAALKEVISLAKSGVNISFTPDGPKGPRHVVQPGVIQAAKATGLTIYPVTYSALKKKLFNPGTAS